MSRAMQCLLVMCCVLFFCFAIGCAQTNGAGMTIQNGKQVSFDYKLTVDGQVADSSEGRGPLEYTHGSGQIIPGLAKQLEGMKVGEEKTVSVPPEEAYGVVNPQAVQEVPKSQLPPTLQPQVGMMLQLKNKEGQAMPARILEVKPDSIKLDFNHPLAGKTLVFNVKIVSIK